MKNRAGFTLVELVVVVLILGILAGVAAPRMIDTAGTATDNGLRQTLSIVRNAIELYTADAERNPNVGRPPAFTNTADFHLALAPYIRGAFPDCPVGAGAGTNTVVELAPTDTSTNATGAWRYDSATGDFRVNFAGPTTIDPTTNYDEL